MCYDPVSVCLSSVCLSVRNRYCAKIAKRKITQTTPHNSPETLVFCCQRSWFSSTEDMKYMSGRLKSVIFRHISERSLSHGRRSGYAEYVFLWRLDSSNCTRLTAVSGHNGGTCWQSDKWQTVYKPEYSYKQRRGCQEELTEMFTEYLTHYHLVF